MSAWCSGGFEPWVRGILINVLVAWAQKYDHLFASKIKSSELQWRVMGIHFIEVKTKEKGYASLIKDPTIGQLINLIFTLHIFSSKTIT